MKILLPVLIAFIVSLALIPWLKRLSIKFRLYDNPEGDALKIHQKPISYLGGVGIFLGFVAALFLSYLLQQTPGRQLLGVAIGSVVILFLGFLDDFKWKKDSYSMAKFKFLYQIMASCLVLFILIKIIGISPRFALNSILAILIALFYIVGAINTLNLEDGLDGLAGGLTVISLFGFIVLSLTTNNAFSLLISLSLGGAVVGFLIYNWHPASVFMGDNGSYFLGFILALLAILFSGHPFYNFRAFVGPILIIGLPIIDTAWAIIRRLARGISPFMGDRSHLYDSLQQKGLGTRRTVLICYLIQVIIVGAGVLIYQL